MPAPYWTQPDVAGLEPAAARRGIDVEELAALALHHMAELSLVDAVIDDAT